MPRELKHSEAKPCPFCGEHDVKVYEYPDECFIQCQVCTTTGPNGADEESALLQWNTRTSPVKERLLEDKPLTPGKKWMKCLDGSSEQCVGQFITTPEVRTCWACRQLRESFELNYHGNRVARSVCKEGENQ